MELNKNFYKINDHIYLRLIKPRESRLFRELLDVTVAESKKIM